MQLGRNVEEAVLAARRVGQTEQRANSRPIRRRIPFDDDQLRVEACAAALLVEAVDEGLEALQRIAAVVVVARCDDDAQIWRRTAGRQVGRDHPGHGSGRSTGVAMMLLSGADSPRASGISSAAHPTRLTR